MFFIDFLKILHDFLIQWFFFVLFNDEIIYVRFDTMSVICTKKNERINITACTLPRIQLKNDG